MRGLSMMFTQYLFLIFFIKAYAVGTRNNSEAIQMSTHNICFYEEVDTNTWAVT